MEDPKIPVFSVLKKGTTLKNIFLNSPPSETGKAISPSRDNGPILIGRHPDCHIFVDHPSISRFHLEVHPKSSLQKLFVTDRSSVHGTWVSGKKIEPNIPVELIEGDTIRLGASTRIYQLQWMPLSRAFEMEKQMSPLMEEASDEVLQDENFNEEWVSNVVPSAPPMMINEIQPEREEPNPLRSDKIVKSSSLLLRRNKSISFLQIENMSKENGCEIKKGEEYLEKEEEEEFFVSDKENMTPVNSIGSKVHIKSNRKIERSPLSSFSLFHKEDLEIEEQKVGGLIEGNGEEIPLVFLAEGDVKEEEEMCDSDEEKMTLVNSIGSKVLIKSNRKIERTPLSSFSLFHKEDLEIEEQKVGGLIKGNGEEIPSVFLAEGDVKEEEEMCGSDEEKMSLVKSIGSTVLKSNREINRSLLSSLSTFNLEEEPSNSDKPTSEATEQFKSNKLRSRSCLMKENGDSKLSDAKNLESLFSPGVKLQRSLFKLERSPLGEKKALNVEEDRFLSDKENWTPKVPKSLLRSGKAFARDLLMAESEVVDETFASDKENLTPHSSMAIKSKNALSQNHGKNEGEILRRRKERIPFLPLFVSSPLRNSSPASYVEGLDETFFKNFVNNVHNLDEKAPDREHKEELPHTQGREKKKWYIVVDVGCFLTEESRKSLQLLEGIRGTQLIIPRIVIRELDHLKRCQGILSRGTKASSILQWIEDSMMKTSWWIHVQSSSETFPVAPTPPATPRSQLCDGSSGFGATTSTNFASFSTCGSLMEIVSPTAEDHILDCALLFKRIKDDGQLMLLTNSTTLRIKAMAEGLLCETPKEFRESLVNPFSKRFLWADSSPRGSTWSCLEEVGLPENCHQQFVSARMPKAEGTVKGLKLILLHSSSIWNDQLDLMNN